MNIGQVRLLYLYNTRAQNNTVLAVGQWKLLEEAEEWGITRAGQHAPSMGLHLVGDPSSFQSE